MTACVLGLVLMACDLTGPLAVECKAETVGTVRLECARAGAWRFALRSQRISDGLEVVDVDAEADEEGTVPAFKVSFSIPRKDVHHMWNPFGERFDASWGQQSSSFSTGLPIRANFDDSERNVVTLSVSDALHLLQFRTGVGMKNENAHVLDLSASFFDAPSAPMRRYSARLRIDKRRIFWYDAVADGVDWICRTSGRKPAVPPPAAYDPVYSSWYVFRQTVTQAALDPELERAAALGMKVVILDDGWQVERGEWQIDRGKFPDLAAQVAKAHSLGLKFVLWLALPHVSSKSPVYARFRDKLLSDKPDHWGLYSFDPRFPDVRAHLVRRVTELMRDYGLDGFKLDFIDNFVSSPANPAARNGFVGCDMKGVPEATEVLLREIHDAVTALRPDALIEFRQQYVGPVVRQYGNMLRANDCPGDFQANRYRTLALRAISEGSSVHADMLMWRRDDTVEELKRQVWNVLFSVVQYSAYLGNLPPDHLDAVRQAIAFTQAHRQTLLFGRLRPHHPELGYPVVEAEGRDERIIAVYAPEFTVALPGDGKRTIVVNATTATNLVVDVAGKLSRVAIEPSGVKEL